MNRTECTLRDAANKIEKDFLIIGVPTTLKDFLTSEEYETLRFASKGFLPDNCEENWEVINQIAKKVNKLALEAPEIKINSMLGLVRKESTNLKPKIIGFEYTVFDLLLKKVNEFISSDECGEFIDFDFKVTEHNHHFVYSGFVKYRASASDNDDSQKRCDSVKEFASEVRKTIEDTFKKFGGSTYFSFADHGLDLVETIQNKLDEILK